LSGGRASAPDHNWALTTRSLHLQLQRIFQRSSLRCFEAPAPSSGSIPRASVPTRLVALVFARDDRERACCPSGPPGVATSFAVMHGPVPPALVWADPPLRGGQGFKSHYHELITPRRTVAMHTFACHCLPHHTQR